MGAILAGLVLAVSVATTQAPLVTPFESGGFEPRAVSVEQRPYADLRVVRGPVDEGVVDDQGVRMFRAPDGTLHQHPVAQAQYGLRLIASYRATGDHWYLDHALLQGARLVSTHIDDAGAWLFPYDLPFTLRGDPTDTLEPPWYSAMAEGLALSLFVALSEETGDPAWKSAADSVFPALLREPGPAPWTVHVDDEGYLWLEEYPRTPAANSERVLNGHMFTLFGLYDYWRLTGDSRAAQLFDGGVTTVLHYLPRFRNAAWASSYSLRGLTPHLKYHLVHIAQLLDLAALTGDERLAAAAERLNLDYPAPQKGVLVAARGTLTSVAFAADGSVASSRATVLRHVSTAPVSYRGRVRGQPGFWLRISAGPLAGRWVRESPGRAVLRGVAGRLVYRANRYALQTDATAPGGTRKVRVLAFGWVGGRLSVQLVTGPKAGSWVPLTATLRLPR